jgi:hypothetical protein
MELIFADWQNHFTAKAATCAKENRFLPASKEMAAAGVPILAGQSRN